MSSSITPLECKETHPNFTITCDKCQSTRVYFENSIGWSQTSGGWGSADLICADCNATTELISG